MVGQSCFKEYIAGRLRGAVPANFEAVSLATFFINDCGKAPPGRGGARAGGGAPGCNFCSAGSGWAEGCGWRPRWRGGRAAGDL